MTGYRPWPVGCILPPPSRWAPMPRPCSAPAGLVAYWPLAERAGTVAFDVTNTHHGSYYNHPPRHPGPSSHSVAGLDDGAWHHMVFTRAQASGTLTLYIDGAPVATGHGGTPRLASAPGLRIGSLQSAVHFLPAASLMLPSTTLSYPQPPWPPIFRTGTEPRPSSPVASSAGPFGAPTSQPA